eukprot:7087331-Pyramimonas_sp.AAC.1
MYACTHASARPRVVFDCRPIRAIPGPTDFEAPAMPANSRRPGTPVREVLGSSSAERHLISTPGNQELKKARIGS